MSISFLTTLSNKLSLVAVIISTTKEFALGTGIEPEQALALEAYLAPTQGRKLHPPDAAVPLT